MSRIGKQPISLPSGVTVNVAGGVVSVKGSKGELKQSFDSNRIAIKVDDGTVNIERLGETKPHRAMHGLYRALVANMVEGVTNGFKRELEINGVGYTAKAAGKKLTLQIGFCHPVEFQMPEGLVCETPSNTVIVLKGPDKQVVGQMAANIRRVRPPEPYKGKGIRYQGEYIRRKAGKSVAGK